MSFGTAIVPYLIPSTDIIAGKPICSLQRSIAIITLESHVRSTDDRCLAFCCLHSWCMALQSFVVFRWWCMFIVLEAISMSAMRLSRTFLPSAARSSLRCFSQVSFFPSSALLFVDVMKLFVRTAARSVPSFRRDFCRLCASSIYRIWTVYCNCRTASWIQCIVTFFMCAVFISFISRIQVVFYWH